MKRAPEHVSPVCEQVVLLAYVGLLVPYRIGFTHDTTPADAFFWIDVLVDLYFICDIFLTFRTGES